MRVAWRFIGGFGRCLRFIGGSRWLSSSIRWLSSSILSGSSWWPSSKNHGSYPRRIKFVALPEDGNRRLLLITTESMNGGLISSPRKSVDIGPPNSLISLLAKGSRRNRSKLLERFIFSSQERTSMLNQRFE